MEPSAAIEGRIRENVERLGRLYDRIVRCHVVIEAPHRHRHKGNTFSVKIDLLVPRAEIVVSREPTIDPAHTDLYVALRDAFNAAARRLEDHSRRLRGYTKTHLEPEYGRVSRLFRDDGYGFIETTDGLEIYFHENSVSGDDFPRLRQGSAVRFALSDRHGEKGPQASTVHVVPE
jgi:cold shock CspA family protein/ribosome-associated translation inhibitor RaiA